MPGLLYSQVSASDVTFLSDLNVKPCSRNV